MIFCHDLIYEEAYKSMLLDEQKSLHLRIGQFLGTYVDATVTSEQEVTEDLRGLHLKDQTIYTGRNFTSTILSVTCDQVNAAGPNFITEQGQRDKCARWNLSAGQQFVQQVNFSAAQHYYIKGIEFLGNIEQFSWSTDNKLCLSLHNGAVLASFSLGDTDNVERYAKSVIEHAPLNDTLDVQVIILKSLASSDKHIECMSQGIDLLRQLNFSIPLAPSKRDIADVMVNTSSMATQYSTDHIACLCKETIESNPIVRVADAMYISATFTNTASLICKFVCCLLAFFSLFPLLTQRPTFTVPLIVCSIVQFSLVNGICPEAAVFLASFGFLKVMFGEDYSEAKFWADMARRVNNSPTNKNKNAKIRTEMNLVSQAGQIYAALYSSVRKIFCYKFYFFSTALCARHLLQVASGHILRTVKYSL